MFYNFAPSGLCWFHSFHSQVSQALQPVLYNLAPLGLFGFIRFFSQIYSLCCIISLLRGLGMSSVAGGFYALQGIILKHRP